MHGLSLITVFSPTCKLSCGLRVKHINNKATQHLCFPSKSNKKVQQYNFSVFQAKIDSSLGTDVSKLIVYCCTYKEGLKTL